MSTRRTLVSWAFCLGNVAIAALLLLGVFAGLPVRWWVVDASALGLSLLLLGSAFGLARAASWALPLVRVSAAVGLLLGLSAVAALGLAAAFLSGVHGALGQSGALTVLLVSALALPYLILYPSAQLLWVHTQLRGAATP